MSQRRRRQGKMFCVAAPVVLILLSTVCPGRTAWSQDLTQDPFEQGPQSEEKRRTVQEARAYLEQFVVTDRDGNRYQPLEQPLLSSSDLARGELGWTWAFGQAGQPVFIMELYKYTRRRRWEQALTLTSDVLIEARLPNERSWFPQKTQLQLRDLPNSPAPSERSVVRRGQAKQLARRFDAHEFWEPNNSRFELRLLQTPLYTYADQERGILDGAVFALAHGTNPEVFLLIEAHDGKATKSWKYGLARIGSAELHVALDGVEVWQLDRAENVVGRPSDPYWITAARFQDD